MRDRDRSPRFPAVRSGRIEPDGRGARVAVLSLHFPPEYSGAGIQLATLVEAMRRRGVSFTVLTASGAPSSSEPGLDVLRWRASGDGLLPSLRFGLRAALWLLLHPGRWDLLHTIDFSYFSVPAWAVARLLRRPVLVKTTLLEEMGGSLGARLLRRVRGLGYRGADAVVALSDELEARLRTDFAVRGRVLRIPNGVDTARFRPPAGEERAASRRALGLSEQALVVTLCGMRIARKNALHLVGAAARMRHRPVQLLLVGPQGFDPAYEARLRAAIDALPEGVAARVIDDLPPDGVADALRASDVYVLPSSGEGLPNSVLEGMATGLPCVASDIPGSRDVLAGGVGRLFPLGDVEALAAVLDALAADPDARARLGEAGLRRVQETFALDRVAERYQAAYATLLGGPAESGAAH